MLSEDPNTNTENCPQNQAALATVLGESITELPQDLYIPPQALQIFLEAFSGPLDLLLYLIKKQNINILDLPIAKITEQYLAYIELMKDFRIELAAEYLVMAAMLAEIKSRLLLPKPQTDISDEEDPRAELVRRLQEYERYKKLAENLDDLPRLERDIFLANAAIPALKAAKPLPEVKLNALCKAFAEVLAKAKLFEHHHIQRETLTVHERMSQILDRLKKEKNEKFIAFYKLFPLTEGRSGVIVTFMALLELLKQAAIQIVQAEPFADIHLQAKERSL